MDWIEAMKPETGTQDGEQDMGTEPPQPVTEKTGNTKKDDAEVLRTNSPDRIMPGQEYLNAGQCATYLGMSKTAFNVLRRANKFIPGYVLPGMKLPRWKVSEIDAWVRTQTQER